MTYCETRNGQLAGYSKGLFDKYLEAIAAESTERVELMLSMKNDKKKFYIVKSLHKMPVLIASSKWSKKLFFLCKLNEKPEENQKFKENKNTEDEIKLTGGLIMAVIVAIAFLLFITVSYFCFVCSP